MDVTKTFQLRPLEDRNRLREFFYQDRPLSAYALGDLEDDMWEISTFTGAFDRDTLVGVSLVWRGSATPVFIVIAPPEAADALMSDSRVPDEIFYMMPGNLLGVLENHFDILTLRRIWRMVVKPADFVDGPSNPGLRRLTSEDASKVRALFSDEPMRADRISPELIEQGTFYGVEEDGEIIALAGTHIYAENEGVGVVGYVYTAPEARGRGLATAATGAVTRELIGRGIDHVVLNVMQDNPAALRSYQKLGFRIHADLVDGTARRK